MPSSLSRFAVGRWWLVPAVVALAAVASCSLVLDADEPQCSTDAECVAKGAAESRCVESYCVLAAGGGAGGSGGAPITDPDWSCIGTLTTPPAEAPTIHVRLPLVDFISRTTMRPDVTVRVCARLDVQCSTPLGTPAITDAAGVATLEIPADPPFDGFFQIDGTPNVMPSLVFAQPLTTTEGATLSTILTFVPAEYRALVEAGGNVWNEARGHLFVQARNCAGGTADGVAYAIPKLEADTVRVFLRDGVPDRNAPDTDATGIGGFIHCGAGYHTVTGTLTDGGHLVNDRRVFVRPLSITYTVMSPVP